MEAPPPQESIESAPHQPADASAGFIGSGPFFGPTSAGPQEDEWYRRARKAPLHPPERILVVVSFIVVTFAGLAVIRIWQQEAVQSLLVQTVSIASWLVLALLVALWLMMVFQLKNPLAALVVLLAAAVVALGVLVLFTMQDQQAGTLMLPLLVWSGFLAYLNGYILRYNDFAARNKAAYMGMLPSSA
jgi:tryptophan-rich sensory protein